MRDGMFRDELLSHIWSSDKPKYGALEMCARARACVCVCVRLRVYVCRVRYLNPPAMYIYCRSEEEIEALKRILQRFNVICPVYVDLACT